MPTPEEPRPNALDPLVSPLAWLASPTADRHARHRRSMASPGIPSLLALEGRAKRRGRPRLTADERQLIEDMALDNPTWGAPRIHDELAKLGIEVIPVVSENSTDPLMPPSGYSCFVSD